MSIKTKKRFKNLGKTIGIGLFTLLMLTNIKLALLDDSELASGDIFLFGIEVELFDATFGESSGQDYRISMGAYGCPEDYDYWARCGLPGNECSFMDFTCF